MVFVMEEEAAEEEPAGVGEAYNDKGVCRIQKAEDVTGKGDCHRKEKVGPALVKPMVENEVCAGQHAHENRRVVHAGLGGDKQDGKEEQLKYVGPNPQRSERILVEDVNPKEARQGDARGKENAGPPQGNDKGRRWSKRQACTPDTEPIERGCRDKGDSPPALGGQVSLEVLKGGSHAG